MRKRQLGPVHSIARKQAIEIVSLIMKRLSLAEVSLQAPAGPRADRDQPERNSAKPPFVGCGRLCKRGMHAWPFIHR